MEKVKAGDVLVHPAHGNMRVTNVGGNMSEYIEAEQDFVDGYRVEAVFDRFIPGVKWTATGPDGKRISKLVFHSYYLRNLKRA